MAGKYVAGHYTATWNGSDIGSTEDGYHIRARQHEQGVKDDAFGEADADAVDAGTDYEIEFTSIEWTLIKAALAARGASGATLGDVNAQVGILLSTLGKSLVLTPASGTSAAASGNTLTATKAVIVGDYSWNDSYQYRKIPATFHLYPDVSVSNKAFTLA